MELAPRGRRLARYQRLIWGRALCGLLAFFTAGSIQAQEVPSTACPGALETLASGGSVVQRVIPAGGSATCIETPSQTLALEPDIRGTGNDITLAIAAGVLVPSFLLEGNRIELLNSGSASGDIIGSMALVATAVDSRLSLNVDGDGTAIENLGWLELDGAGDFANIANGGVLRLLQEGANARVRNDPEAVFEGLIVGDSAIVDNLGVLTRLEIIGGGAEITNDGFVVSGGLDGSDDTIGILVVGADAKITNLGDVQETAVPGSDEGALAIAVQGDRAQIRNLDGFVTASGFDVVAIGVEGANAEIDNAAVASVLGEEATAVFVEGASARVSNTGSVGAWGAGATAISIEGNDAEIENVGAVAAQGLLASGVFVAGDNAMLDLKAGGAINTSEGAIAAAAVFGDGADITQAGDVETSGSNAFGIAALGLGADLKNQASGTISTSGTNADAIVLGLESVPAEFSGLPLPPGALQPAQGGVTNDGTIETSGQQADAIALYADGSTVRNRGTLDTADQDAYGVRVRGDGNLVENGVEGESVLSGVIRTQGADAHGISLTSADPLISGTVANFGLITTDGARAHGVFVNANDAVIANDGVVLATGEGATAIASVGRGTTVNRGVLRAGDPESATSQKAGGIQYAADQEVTNSAGAEIVVFGDSGRGIFHDPNERTNGASIVNRGELTLTGADGIGIQALGPAASQPQSQVRNIGRIRMGGETLIDPGEPQDPVLNPLLGPAARGAAIVVGGHVQVENEAQGQLMLRGDDSVAIRSTEEVPLTTGAIINRGAISVQGLNSGAVAVTGDNVTVFNGSVADTAKISVSGANAFGLRSEGVDQFMVNSGELVVDGDNSTHMEVRLTDDGQLWMDSSSELRVTGTSGIAMHAQSLVADRELRITNSSTTALNCVGGGLAGGRIINCGGIALTESQGATAMLVEGIGNTFIENQAGIAGSGNQQRGIVVEAATGSGTPEGQVNFIENLAAIELSGQGATGVLINGSGNFLLNGTGVTRFDLAPGLPEGLTGTISSNIDKMESRGTATGPIESQQIGAAGVIEVSGPGARALVVNGTGNLISNRISQVTDTDGNTTDVAGRIAASGVGGIAVEMQGNAHVLDNDGVISGTQFAVLADDGAQTLINKNTINGEVALGGGDDRVVFIPGVTFNGGVDAGEGEDTLSVVFEGDADINADFLSGGPVNGDTFTNFEKFVVDLEDPIVDITLQNTLVVDQVRLESGFILLDDAFLNSPDISLGAFTGIRGTGVLGSTPTGDPGNFGVFGDITLADGSSVGPGQSPGSLTFLGDVTSEAVFDIEIGGLDIALHDVINVEGDLTLLGGAINFIFIDGFLPSLGDSFDVFNVSGLLSGLSEVSLSFAGLPSGFDFGLEATPFGLSLAALGTPDASVPEPGSWALLAGGLTALAWRRRQRRSLRT